MLQHNNTNPGRRAHLAHAAVIGLHAVCCGVPALALLLAAASGATSGLALALGSFLDVHQFLHGNEVWILVISAGLVLTGGWLEASARRRRQAAFPWLFAFSVLCFLANLALILAHRSS